MWHDEKTQRLQEIEELLNGLSEAGLLEALGFARMIKGEAPGVGPEIILRMHRALIVGMRRNGETVSDDILTRLSAMVQEILDGVPSVRDRYILRSFFLLGDDTNKYRVEDALEKSGLMDENHHIPA